LDESAGAQGVEICLLGPLEVRVGGERASIAGTKQRSVLALLALAANNVVSTDSLIDQVWGETAAPAVRRSLQVYVSNLRKVLADGARIESRGGGYILEIEPDRVDLTRFGRLVREGRLALEQGKVDVASSRFRGALDLWRGTPLSDLMFEAFASAHIERLEQEQLAVLEDRIDADLALGRHFQIAPEIGDLVAENPMRERLRAQLMLAFYRCGRQADALNEYRKGRDLLIEQLGVEPSAELQALERAILDHDEAIDAQPVSLGEEPAGADADADRPVERPSTPTNLQRQLTSFVGRERELVEIKELLVSSRLVTLTGPGGSGKTRLAVAVASELLCRFPDGVWFVDLAPLADGALVGVTVAGVLGVRDDSGRSTIETLVDSVRGREMLIVIDNCEHVIDSVAKVADALLRSCPSASLLATSREPLGISGEHVYRVPTLQVPSEEDADLIALVDSDAVRLFVARVAQHTHAFALDPTNAPAIARVCRRLDGIPLALELAAAKLRWIGLDEVEARLSQRFLLLTGGLRTALPRQRTLRALIDWSWELLTDAEKMVLARLSVFAGSWDLDAAEGVLPARDVEAWEVFGLLEILVDKSLVQIDDTAGFVRYRLLESVREYARERLAEFGDTESAAAASRHRDYYLALAETAAPHLTSHGQTEWLDRLDCEHDNLRAAIGRSLSEPHSDRGIRLAVALQWFWQFRGPAAAGAEVLTLLLDRPDAQELTVIRGRALVALAALLIVTGDSRTGRSRAEEALLISRSRGDRSLEAQAMAVLAWVCFRLGQVSDALAFTDAGLKVARLSGDIDATTRLLNARGIALGMDGDVPRALACFREARDLCRESGNDIRVTALLCNLGYNELAIGDLDAARTDLRMALSTALASRDPASANAACNLGLVELVSGDWIAARSLFARALSTARRSGDQNQAAYALFGMALTTLDPDQAVTLHGASDALFDQLGERYERFEAKLRTADRDGRRKQLGVHAFVTAYEAGRSLSRDEAMALALR
jgi:predicted ATPase/DNA-binding SARP family transcriptional activator